MAVVVGVQESLTWLLVDNLEQVVQAEEELVVLVEKPEQLEPLTREGAAVLEVPEVLVAVESSLLDIKFDNISFL